MYTIIISHFIFDEQVL